jgi:hypothetical protein
MNGDGVVRPGTEVMDAVGMVVVQFRKLLGKQLHGKETKL